MAKKLANKFSPIIIVILIALFLYFILRACNVYEGATNMETGFEVVEVDGSRKPIEADSAKFKTFLQDSNIEFSDTSTGGSNGSVTTYNNF
jgi:hypothetical protein